MTAYELLELANNVNNRIDVQLGLFITIHLAIFGGIIYVDRPLRLLEKFFAISAYTGFAFLNFFMMKNQLSYVYTLYSDAVLFINDPCCLKSSVLLFINDQLNANSEEISKRIIFTMHSFLYILVLASIILDKPIKNYINK